MGHSHNQIVSYLITVVTWAAQAHAQAPPAPASSASVPVAPAAATQKSPEPPQAAKDPASPASNAHGGSSGQHNTFDRPCEEDPKKLGQPGQYVVQFNQREARFVYPPYAPFDDDEIVLRICNMTPWKRYRLIFGSKTVGSEALATTTVGYAATEVDAALRGANALLANDHTCTDSEVMKTQEPVDKKHPAGESLRPQCERLRREVAALVNVARVVMGGRDQIATAMAECASVVAPELSNGSRPDGEFLESCRGLLVDGGDGDHGYYDDIGDAVNNLLRGEGIGKQIVWIDDTWHVVDRGPEPEEADDNGGSLKSNPGEGVLPATIVGYLNTRAELITAIQRAMDGYSKLTALSLRIRDDLAQRQTIFRLGRFAGNRIVVATLEEHTVRVGFTQDRKHLQFSTEVVPHQLTLTVHGTSYVQFDIGIAYSSVNASTYATSVRSLNGMPTQVVQKTSDGHDLNPVLFASFLWCAQSLEQPWISRTCRDGSRGAAMWAPRAVIGLPLSADLGRGSAYTGLALPYIPYVSLIAGLNARRVDTLSGINEGDPVANGSNVPTTARLKFGWFASVGVTEEVFYLFVPRMEAAK